MIKLPKITRYSKLGYKQSFVVHINDIKIYYSKDVPIAFETPESGLVVCKNIWGPTTGNHLNTIDGGGKNHKKRVSYVEFEKLWQQYIGEKGIT